MVIPAFLILSMQAGPAVVPPSLVAALMRDKGVSGCAKESGRSPQAYVTGAFDLRHVRLRSSEEMSVAIATDPCLALGQSTRIMIFQKTPEGYRRVLSGVTLPDFARVGSDGTVTLPTHESMEVIFEATYIWNGREYAFAPSRSHRYDVALDQRRPYEVAVRLTLGRPATLSGSVAYNFGDSYSFGAIAGEALTIDLVKHTGKQLRVSLYYRDETSSAAELTAGKWSGKLGKTGTYHLFVSGTDESDESRLSRYIIRISAAR